MDDLLDDADLLALADDDGWPAEAGALDADDLLPLDALDDARLSDEWS